MTDKARPNAYPRDLHVADEHVFWRTVNDGYLCDCGWTAKGLATRKITEHIIGVTERAVAEAIAQEIEDQEAMLRSYVDFTNDEREIGLINGYRRAARIAREGATR